MGFSARPSDSAIRNPSPVSVSDLRPDDLPSAAGLERLSGPSPWTEDQLRAELAKPFARCRAAREGEELAGFAVSWHLGEESQLAEMAVRPASRRRGLGRRLLEDALDLAAGAGARRLTLEVREGNIPARRLYESAGFLPTGRRPRFYEGREDAVLMERRIGN